MEKHKLTRGEDAGGTRYYLDGEPLHCGEAIEMQVGDGSWHPMGFETDSNGRPIGCWEFCLGHPATVRLQSYSVLRRPTG